MQETRYGHGIRQQAEGGWWKKEDGLKFARNFTILPE